VVIKKQVPWKAVVASTVGNALEWYDFLVYGYLSVIIAKQFFPADNPVTSMLLTTATFGVGFIVRPIAGIAIGIYADRAGRKAALSFVILLMLVSTAMLAFSPTYSQVGILAPIIVVCSRILQGISVGGEFGTATALLIEYAPPGRRGFYGSWQMFSQSIGVFLATLMGALLTSVFTTEALSSWAWRIPFLLGLIIGPIGFYIRRNLQEPEIFLKETQHKKVSIGEIFRRYPAELFVSFALSAVTNIMVYVRGSVPQDLLERAVHRSHGDVTGQNGTRSLLWSPVRQDRPENNHGGRPHALRVADLPRVYLVEHVSDDHVSTHHGAGICIAHGSHIGPCVGNTCGTVPDAHALDRLIHYL
jgi:MFS family permease